MQRWTIGVDFGGTNVKVGLVADSGRVVRSQVLSSKVFGRPGPFVEGIGRAVTALTQAGGIRISQLRGIGVGAPGAIDCVHGIVLATTNVPGWHRVPLARLLERRLGRPCVVDNDANLATLGEWRFGAGRGSRVLVGLTLGTGVGGGLVCNGRLFRGVSGSAGEIGHMVIHPGGRRCGCGARGCLEAEVGTAAILSMGRRAIRRGAEPLKTLARSAHGNLTPAIIAQAARAGDTAARQIWVQIGQWLGLALASLVNVLNPDRIVIGGGIANAWPLFSPALNHTLDAHAMGIPKRAVRVLRARLGDHAGVLGAAAIVRQELG
jgi:glucokinase